MNILVACEYSGRVRDAFNRRGHNAISCDLLPTESPGPHFMGPVERVIKPFSFPFRIKWNMMIAFPPCTHLASSGAAWFKNKQDVQPQAIEFFMMLVNADIPKIAVENPIGIMSTRYRKPDQIIQPWMFGHGETKATCLWLKGLPKLVPTHIVEGREQRLHKLGPSPDRAKIRSLTYQGIADAMAEQWG